MKAPLQTSLSLSPPYLVWFEQGKEEILNGVCLFSGKMFGFFFFFVFLLNRAHESNLVRRC